MSKQRTSLIFGDDWSAVYVNDICVWQGHSLSASLLVHILKENAVDLNLCELEFTEKCSEHLEEDGRFPDNLDELESWI
jgi:hypothetical protein